MQPSGSERSAYPRGVSAELWLQILLAFHLAAHHMAAQGSGVLPHLTGLPAALSWPLADGQPPSPLTPTAPQPALPRSILMSGALSTFHRTAQFVFGTLGHTVETLEASLLADNVAVYFPRVTWSHAQGA